MIDRIGEILALTFGVVWTAIGIAILLAILSPQLLAWWTVQVELYMLEYVFLPAPDSLL